MKEIMEKRLRIKTKIVIVIFSIVSLSSRIAHGKAFLICLCCLQAVIILLVMLTKHALE